MPPGSKSPIFSECKRLDFELEMGAILGGPNATINKLGNPIKVEDAENFVFGFVLVNDHSARDI